ncbi:MAG: EAL domain-containing protein [Alteromonadaceae bacterium]|nr:EAL domain-containing protein [Alteromonadaceae bacterium]
MTVGTTHENSPISEDENILNSLFKVLPDLFFLLDKQGFILAYRVNDESCFFLNLTNCLNKQIQTILPPHVALLFNENVQAISIDDEMVTFDYGIEVEHSWHQFQARLIKLPDSEKIIAIIQNITERVQTEVALKNSEAIYRQMFEKNQAIKLIIDPSDGYIIEANAAALKFYGYSYQDLVAKRISELNILSEQEIAQEMELAQQEHRLFFNFRHKIASNEIKDVEVYSGPITVAGKELLFSIIQDVTNKKQIEQELRQTEQQFRDLFNNINSEIFIKNISGEYIAVNDHFLTAGKLTASDIIGKTDDEVYSAEKAKIYRQSDLDSLASTHAITTEDIIIKNQKHCYYSTVKFPLTDANGKAYAICGVSTEITDKKLAEEKIIQQAHFDALTHLPNRFLSLDRLDQMLKEAQRSDEKVAILFLDLDDFKKINDSLGHEVGDKLLIESAKRLNMVIRNEDTVGRLGGDEFIVLLRGIHHNNDAQPVTDALLQKFREPFNIDNRELILTASVGIAIYPDDATSASELLRNVDTAMYQAKALGRDNFSYFTESMNHDVSRRLELEEQIRGALERSEFSVHYQIQMDMKTNTIIGAEALLRWNNCCLGNISPDEFIPVAEQTGLIVSLGKFVLQQALKTVKQWHQLAPNLSSLRIAVNLSPRQFRDPALVSYIENALIEQNVSACNLELEITEGVLMSGHAYIDEALKSLSKLGILLSMDDFGTGYSSLSYLRTYPFNVLKVDRCFVSGITENNADKELVNATIAMAHALGLKVVAEGIETQPQYQLLAKLGCDYAQGYLLSKPLPKDELFKLVENFSF